MRNETNNRTKITPIQKNPKKDNSKKFNHIISIVMKAGASLNPMYLYKVSRKGVII